MVKRKKLKSQPTFISDASGKEYPLADRVTARSLRSAIFQLIRNDVPLFSRDHVLSMEELNHYREKYIAGYLMDEAGELSDLEKKVLKNLGGHRAITSEISGRERPATLGQRVADRVAGFGGSWTFITAFGGFLLLWIAFNVFWLRHRAFDPYPFILLNLILSCLAAMQAPIIMMSQNRQEEKDRERSRQDYMINLKSELEIRILHEKLDHLIMHQQHELIEIQKVQIDMMNDILKRIQVKRSKKGRS